MTRQEFEDALLALDDTAALVPAPGLAEDPRRHYRIYTGAGPNLAHRARPVELTPRALARVAYELGSRPHALPPGWTYAP
jgi:hypothetical protein